MGLVEGLASIHAAGVAHGDLHTGVLMRAPDGTLRITDFSAAKSGASTSMLQREMRSFACSLGVLPPAPELQQRRQQQQQGPQLLPDVSGGAV